MTTYDQIARAIAAYEGSPEVNSFSSKYDLATAGKAQFTPEEKAGYALFSPARRHTLPMNATATEWPGRRAAVYRFPRHRIWWLRANRDIPFYNEGRVGWLRIQSEISLALNFVDGGVRGLRLGPANPNEQWTQYAKSFIGRYKTPTLRNADRRPRPDFVKAYMHNGYLKSLREVVHFYNTRDVLPECRGGDPGEKVTCWPAPEHPETMNRRQLGNLGLSSEQEDQLVAFLKTLSDGYEASRLSIEVNMNNNNRWFIAAAGVFMQVALGAVYAWSVFRIPLSKAHGWSVAEVTTAFEIAIFVLGLAAFAGGLWMRRKGPRPVALAAAVLYGLGTMLAGSAHDLTVLYLTYGVIGGTGLGLGYIVPIATLVRWFPDKRGVITGLAVAGFGAGALVTAPAANALIASVGVGRTFEVLGLVYLVVVFVAALAMRNPPADYAPGGTRSAAQIASAASHEFTLRQARGTWQWYALWLTLFLNTTAGISIISQASPMAQEISNVSATAAAGMVGVIAIGNGSGRFLWAWLSDKIGRRNVFLMMFGVQAAAFLLLSQVHQFALLTILAFIILMCYGGGFGTMPAFATDYFGPGQIGSIYGFMLTAWGCAAVFGPSLVAGIRQATGHYSDAMLWLALATLISTLVPLVLRPPSPRGSREPGIGGLNQARSVRT